MLEHLEGIVHLSRALKAHLWNMAFLYQRCNLLRCSKFAFKNGQWVMEFLSWTEGERKVLSKLIGLLKTYLYSVLAHPATHSSCFELDLPLRLVFVSLSFQSLFELAA